jgi:tetratricopeptide (TPR) repeat protein
MIGQAGRSQMDNDAANALKAARTKLQSRDARGAVEALKTVAEAGERTGEILELMGIAHGMAGNTSAARAALVEATRLEPGRASAHFNYAVLLSRDGELEMAVEEANTAAYIDPKHVGAQQLQQQLAQRIRDRKLLGDADSPTIGTGPQVPITSASVSQLICEVCRKPNPFQARVCRHCGTFIKEMPDVVPVE